MTPTETPRLMPPVFREAAMRFRAEELSDDAAAALGVALPEDVRRAVPKRRAEYVAGRSCALVALRGFLPGFAGEIASDHGAPRWPAGFVGSITHTTDFAWATVARASDVRSVGIDAESIPAPGRIEAIRHLAMAPGDSCGVGGAGFDEAVGFALLFSAKESLFKCLHPLVRRMFWYQDASIAVSPDGGLFRATLRIDLDAEFRAGRVLEGRYGIGDGRVATSVAILAG
jgi:enterobactin synthetase component D